MDKCCEHHGDKKEAHDVVVNKKIGKLKYFFVFFVLLIMGGFIFAAYNSGKSKDVSLTGKTINVAAQKEIVVYKSDACGCCDGYMSHLDKKGFDVKPVEVGDISDIKQKYDIPIQMQSCHTSLIDGYVVEGHVPAEAINKLLSEKPDIVGIALPGMPSASPGMPGAKTGEFTIYALEKDGTSKVFMTL